MFKSKIEVDGNELLLFSYFDALKPEENFKTERAFYTVKREKNKIVVSISAKDATAFRAVSSNLTGLMSIVEKTWLQKNKEEQDDK